MRNSSGRDLSAQYALEQQPARFRRDQAQPEIAPAQRGPEPERGQEPRQLQI